MDTNTLKEILEKHTLWLQSNKKGEKADLSSADLSSANLSSANLSSANLYSVNLRYANLRYVNLSRCVNIFNVGFLDF